MPEAPSGVEYVVISQGRREGRVPQPADKVKVHYDGRQAKSGEAFDSSYDEDPVTFRLNTVIPGWQYGLGKMQAGDEACSGFSGASPTGEEGYRGDPAQDRPDVPASNCSTSSPAVSADLDRLAKVTRGRPVPATSTARIPA